MSIDPMNIEQENKYTEIVHEGLYMHIFCVVNEKNKCGGCKGVVTMETLTDQFHDPKLSKKLENEHKLTHHLSELSFIRPTLKLVKRGNCMQYILSGWKEKHWNNGYQHFTENQKHLTIARGTAFAVYEDIGGRYLIVLYY
eukprot:10265266-Ditylum_brightwellii.AAC.1